jgi:hypothetical protein
MAAGSPCKSNTSKRFWYPFDKGQPVTEAWKNVQPVQRKDTYAASDRVRPENVN